MEFGLLMQEGSSWHGNIETQARTFNMLLGEHSEDRASSWLLLHRLYASNYLWDDALACLQHAENELSLCAFTVPLLTPLADIIATGECCGVWLVVSIPVGLLPRECAARTRPSRAHALRLALMTCFHAASQSGKAGLRCCWQPAKMHSKNERRRSAKTGNENRTN